MKNKCLRRVLLLCMVFMFMLSGCTSVPQRSAVIKSLDSINDDEFNYNPEGLQYSNVWMYEFNTEEFDVDTLSLNYYVDGQLEKTFFYVDKDELNINVDNIKYLVYSIDVSPEVVGGVIHSRLSVSLWLYVLDEENVGTKYSFVELDPYTIIVESEDYVCQEMGSIEKNDSDGVQYLASLEFSKEESSTDIKEQITKSKQLIVLECNRTDLTAQQPGVPMWYLKTPSVVYSSEDEMIEFSIVPSLRGKEVLEAGFFSKDILLSLCIKNKQDESIYYEDSFPIDISKEQDYRIKLNLGEQKAQFDQLIDPTLRENEIEVSYSIELSIKDRDDYSIVYSSSVLPK